LGLAALATAAALGLLARAWPGGRSRRRLALLAGLWVGTVVLTWPATRLTADLAFLFGSQATVLVATALWLAARRRHGRTGPGAGPPGPPDTKEEQSETTR
ncbi:MAG TPA: hypothetical protein VNM66_07520, partial [Thermodesulfobacteriota bacterium]|nr:hypothetical protein [Thermodesulfobacteriota bacterium]